MSIADILQTSCIKLAGASFFVQPARAVSVLEAPQGGIPTGIEAQPDHELSVKEVITTAIGAYIYGYLPITFDMARIQQTNVAEADEEHALMGQMIKVRKYLDVDNRCCAAPNQDTLYTMAWLDVTDEPYVFGLPDMGERYAIFPMLDGFSEVFMVAGPGNTGTGAQTYVITGPGWEGTIPEGFTRIKPPTGIVWILGRIYCTGTPEDYGAVNELQDKIALYPLSAYGKEYTPPRGKVDPSIDMKTAARELVNGMDINTYFDYLARLLKTNPPKAEDAGIIARIAKIGLVPGKGFDKDKLGVIAATLLNTVPKLGLLEMARYMKKQETINGWLYFTEGIGNFGTNYVLRGMANLLGPGWNRPHDAAYPIAKEVNFEERTAHNGNLLGCGGDSLVATCNSDCRRRPRSRGSGQKAGQPRRQPDQRTAPAQLRPGRRAAGRGVAMAAQHPAGYPVFHKRKLEYHHPDHPAIGRQRGYPCRWIGRIGLG